MTPSALTTVARHDRTHCIAPGLFLLAPPKHQGRLDVTQAVTDGVSIRYLAPYPLTAFDLRVLQGLVAIAGVRGIRTGDQPADPDTSRARRELLAAATVGTKAAPVDESIYLCETFASIAEEIGMRARSVVFDARYSGGYAKPIRDSMERLFATSVIVDHAGERASFRLISKLATSARRGKAWVLLNPRLSAAVTGGRSVSINMDEVRALKSDASRLIHQYACATIEPGQTGTLDVDALVERSFSHGKVSARSVRERRATVVAGISELSALGWKVERNADDARRFDVTRPAACAGTLPATTAPTTTPTPTTFQLLPETTTA